MKLRYSIFLILLLSAAVFAQNYPDVSVYDIQFKPDTSLINGNDTSPRVGDTVRVTGVVMVPPVVDPTFDRRPIMWAGSRWQTYLRDTAYSNNAFAGLNIIQDDTTSILTLMDLLDTAQVVKITGVVSEFVSSGYTNGQTQLNVLRTEPIQFIDAKPNRGVPSEITIDSIHNGAIADMPAGEKFEGQYVIIRNVVTSDRNNTSGVFWINDALGNKMQIHDQSGYFTKRTHKLREFEPPIDGTTIQYIRGVIGHFSNPNSYVIRPMYPNDLLIGQSPPAISSIRRNSDLVLPNQAVTVTANIVDLDAGGSVTNARIHYRVNGGNSNQLPMTKGLADVWSAIIPGVPDSALVDFYLSATDNDGMTSFNPIDTLKNKYFYLVLNRPITVQDVQYSPFGSGFSAYNNYRVTVSGVVTADTSDLQGDGNQVARRVYIQNGQGPWSGIWVFGSQSDQLMRGQNVTVSGLIREDNSNTRLDSVTQIVVNSSGNLLPNPQLLSTTTIATSSTVPNGAVEAEKWEGVLVYYADVLVTDDNSDGNSGPGGGGNSNFGEISVADTGNVSTRVELQEGNHHYHNMWTAGLEGTQIMQGDSFDQLRGVLFYSFGNYKLVPRKADDFLGYVSDVKDADMNINSYQLMQNYPNPFNPSTSIEYTVPKAGFVTLNVYNILGELVKTLVNMDQNTGSYKVIFNARDLPSGIYFYEISTDNFRQSKKMMLVK